ncbi:MAG TPA: dihydroneopterin aldolase [Saprospiraceae bacterium]|nr:dihydroneopterin aldolase [Saprospiraceae bacterium]HMQ83768.1 dihydroneopterin aldolase [Saprospiraceae bacterium]
MSLVALEGIRFFAHHGYYEEEHVLGGEFVLDVYVSTETKMAFKLDDLYFKEDNVEFKAGVNYETLYLFCQAEIKKPAKLLETIAHRIVERIKAHFDNVSGVKVRVKKIAPPLGGRVDCAFVEVSEGKI